MNDIHELREHLLATLRQLRDPDAPMEVDRARAISHVAQTVIESVRAENEFLRVTGLQSGTGFIAPLTPPPDGIVSITRHLLKG